MFFYKNSSKKVWFASNKRYAMKRLVILVVAATLIGGCGSYNTGELVGVEGRKAYAEPDPFGMVAVPMGSFVMGASDQDVRRIGDGSAGRGGHVGRTPNRRHDQRQSDTAYETHADLPGFDSLPLARRSRIASETPFPESIRAKKTP